MDSRSGQGCPRPPRLSRLQRPVTIWRLSRCAHHKPRLQHLLERWEPGILHNGAGGDAEGIGGAEQVRGDGWAASLLLGQRRLHEEALPPTAAAPRAGILWKAQKGVGAQPELPATAPARTRPRVSRPCSTGLPHRHDPPGRGVTETCGCDRTQHGRGSQPPITCSLPCGPWVSTPTSIRGTGPQLGQSLGKAPGSSCLPGLNRLR